MVTYITVLKVLAACLITNSHYTGVYPVDIIANGGLIGDILFFAVSGYCLYSAKGRFTEWYGKRLVRCYLPVVIITAFYMLLGYYTLETENVFWWYVYPTYYHFVASIIILYIPYYVVVKNTVLRDNLLRVMLAVFGAYLILYLFIYDKGYYHIDNVRQPMIRFLFFESMLLGAWFRQQDERYRQRSPRAGDILLVAVTFVLYFTSKLLFSRNLLPSQWQIGNQLLIFILLYFILRMLSALDTYMNEHIKGKLYTAMTYLASMTLEIYVVQYVVIDVVRPWFSFPLNWVVLTSGILLAAGILHCVCENVLHYLEKIRVRK